VEYLTEVAAADESDLLEKKASLGFDPSKAETKDELAKQTCAFANAGGGFVVWGLPDAGGFDGGISNVVGRQPTTDWVDGLTPIQHHPPLIGCRSAFISDPAHHAFGSGVLVINVPGSESRPHWTAKDEVPYIRAGKHSVPMRLQTLLDIANRRSASTIGAIHSMGAVSDQGFQSGYRRFLVNPHVVVGSGPVATLWAFEMRIHGDAGLFRTIPPNASSLTQCDVLVDGERPLFPRRPTPVGRKNFDLWIKDSGRLTAALYIGASPPVERDFRVGDIIGELAATS
jgi:hypothetical protein